MAIGNGCNQIFNRLGLVGCIEQICGDRISESELHCPTEDITFITLVALDLFNQSVLSLPLSPPCAAHYNLTLPYIILYSWALDPRPS